MIDGVDGASGINLSETRSIDVRCLVNVRLTLIHVPREDAAQSYQ